MATAGAASAQSGSLLRLRAPGISWQGPSPLSQRQTERGPAGGQSPRPAPAQALAGASPPPGRPLASASPRPAGLQGTVPHGRGKRDAFPFPARRDEGTARLQWQGPSPLPQCHATIRTDLEPKPPASARPAHGGRFTPAGSGAGLCWSKRCGSTRHRPARAGGNALRFLTSPRTEAGFQGIRIILLPGRRGFFPGTLLCP